MLVGIFGPLGSGKSLIMTILGRFLADQNKCSLFTAPLHYNVIGGVNIEKYSNLRNCKNGIVVFDEIWLTADARQWKLNIDFSEWIMMTRKRDIVVMYTSQTFRQVDLRVRDVTDYLIICKIGFRNNKKIHYYTIINNWDNKILRTYILEDPEPFYHLYDTNQVMSKLK